MDNFNERGRGVEGEIDVQIGHYSDSGKSLTRHLQGWSRRYVRCHAGLLFLGANAASAKPYCLIPGTLQRHHYAPTGHRHSLSVCCLHGESGQEMEVKFSFRSRKEENSWIQVFKTMLSDLGQQQQYVLFNAVKCISNYLHDRNDKEDKSELPPSSSSGVALVPGLGVDDDDGFELVEDTSRSMIRDLQRSCAVPDGEAAGSEPDGRSCLSRAVLRSRLRPYWSLPIPKLRVLIMTVGTRGDVQPFILLGQRLQRDGHRVRLATHEVFRDFVRKENGLEFYPLGGDPQWLSQFMVKTKGFLLPMTLETIAQVPKNVAMINEIIHSCWGACIYPDPKDELKRPFIADAIISNPVTYGHVHCAEALGVPLHLMFPQPWVPTKAFPHPLSGMKYDGTTWSASNYLSYQTVDGVMWQSFLPYINNFRVKTLKLEPIRFLDKVWDLLNYHKVPFVKMWSRHLAPKPKDWPDHVDIVGAFVNNTAENTNAKQGIKLTSSDDRLSAVAAAEKPIAKKEPDDLEAFLTEPNVSPPIFVGFGSMVVDKPEQLIKTMLEGAALADVRILVQSGWSDINQEWFLRTSEAVERRYNKASAYTSSWASSKTEDVVTPAPAPLNPLQGSILGAIGQPMASSASSSTDSSSSDGGVVRRSHPSDSADTGAQRGESVDRSLPGLSAKTSGTHWKATDALLIGNYPHDKLFPRVAAVVHHGGAGTTAGGLIAGKPTFICPFFGDQNFWGEMVQKAGLGPSPCLVEQLTPQIVAEKFIKLLSADVQSRARKVSVDMKAEGDGVELGLDAFYRHLPVENMICDVSLMRHEVRLAQVYCKTCGLKMARSVSDQLHSTMCGDAGSTGRVGAASRVKRNGSNSGDSAASGHDIVPCIYQDWSLPPPGGVVDGVLQGAGALAHETLGAIADAFTDPLRGVYYGGIQGGIQGVYSGFRSLATRPMEGTRVMYNKVSEGMKGSGFSVRSKQISSESADAERLEDHREGDSVVGGVVPTDRGSAAVDCSYDFPEQAARWYGEASLLMMSSSAQAMADRSFLFSEQDENSRGGAVGAQSIQRYGAQAVMESTIIEELDNEDYGPGGGVTGSGVVFETPTRSIVLSDGTVSPPDATGSESGALFSTTAGGDSTLPSVSGLLRNLDSTNAAIRRYAGVSASVILSDGPDGSAVGEDNAVISVVSEEEDEVQSIVEEDEESESSSIILDSSEGVERNEASRSVRIAPASDYASVVEGVAAVGINGDQGAIAVEDSVELHDDTLDPIRRRSIIQCFYMAQQLQKIFASVTGHDGASLSTPTVKDLAVFVSSAASRNSMDPGRGAIKECGKLLLAPDLLYKTLKRYRKQASFTDIILLYLQEELPGYDPDGSDRTDGLSSMHWCHQVEDELSVWVDKFAESTP